MRDGEQLIMLLVVLTIVGLGMYYRRWRPSGDSHGSAAWCTDKILKAAGMLAGKGLILGRTLAGKVIRLPVYTHTLLVGGTGSGKGVSIIIPLLFSYARGAMFCLDVKGDLFTTCGEFRRSLGRVIRIAPFAGGPDKLNPLDAIKPGPLMIDQARALAEALVVRQGTEPDPHWAESAVLVITAVIVFALLHLEGEERSLNSVREITSSPALLEAAAEKLIAVGGIPARLGSQVKVFFESEVKNGAD